MFANRHFGLTAQTLCTGAHNRRQYPFILFSCLFFHSKPEVESPRGNPLLLPPWPRNSSLALTVSRAVFSRRGNFLSSFWDFSCRGMITYVDQRLLRPAQTEQIHFLKSERWSGCKKILFSRKIVLQSPGAVYWQTGYTILVNHCTTKHLCILSERNIYQVNSDILPKMLQTWARA